MSRRTLTLFGLWAVGLVALAWGFRLRAASAHARLALVAAQKAHAREEGEIQRLEKRNRVVADHLANLRAKREAQPTPTTRTVPEILARLLSQQQKYRALVDDPQMIQLAKARRRAVIRTHYGELYHQLRLSPSQSAALESLLTEGRERQEDIHIAAASLRESLTSPDIRSLLDDEKRTLESQEQALLGPDAFRKLQTFEETAAGRGLVNDVAEALVFSPAPLSGDQKTKLLDLLKSYRTSEVGDDTAPAFDWAAVQAQAATFLTAPQRAELESTIASAQYRQEQRAYGKLLQDWIQQNTPTAR